MALVGKSFGGKSSLLFFDLLDEIAEFLPAWLSRSLFPCEAPRCSSLLQTCARPRPWMIMNACLLMCRVLKNTIKIYKYLPEDRRITGEANKPLCFKGFCWHERQSKPFHVISRWSPCTSTVWSGSSRSSCLPSKLLRSLSGIFNDVWRPFVLEDETESCAIVFLWGVCLLTIGLEHRRRIGKDEIQQLKTEALQNQFIKLLYEKVFNKLFW